MRQVDIVIHTIDNSEEGKVTSCYPTMDTPEEGKVTSLSTLFLTNKFVGLYAEMRSKVIQSLAPSVTNRRGRSGAK